MEIETNNPEYLDDFIRLNEEWILKYFQIEEKDRLLAANPQKVIDDGGVIFSILDEGIVAGVCALFNEGDGVYQLARMAVSPDFQGRGIGNQLMDLCLAKLEELEAKRVYLVSNTILAPAICMYRKYGFEVVPEGAQAGYSRANIMMQRVLG